MRTFDLAPLFRTTVGFDRLNQMLDSARRFDEAPSYPPYNIEKTGDDSYVITMAVAGFGENDLDVVAHDDTLTISGKIAETGEDVTYLHRGIAGRAFERKFQLADHVTVAGAELTNGLLHVDLVRQIPDEMKPRRIAISSAKSATVIEGDKAA